MTLYRQAPGRIAYYFTRSHYIDTGPTRPGTVTILTVMMGLGIELGLRLWGGNGSVAETGGRGGTGNRKGTGIVLGLGIGLGLGLGLGRGWELVLGLGLTAGLGCGWNGTGNGAEMGLEWGLGWEWEGGGSWC